MGGEWRKWGKPRRYRASTTKFLKITGGRGAGGGGGGVMGGEWRKWGKPRRYRASTTKFLKITSARGLRWPLPKLIGSWAPTSVKTHSHTHYHVTDPLTSFLVTLTCHLRHEPGVLGLLHCCKRYLRVTWLRH